MSLKQPILLLIILAIFDDILPSATDLETPLQIVLVAHLGELDVPSWTY